MTGPIRAGFVCGGQYHDFDFARSECLKLLLELPRVRTRVFEHYDDVDALMACDFLLTYTVNLVPTEAVAVQLRDHVAAGHRWLALHGTNSILRYVKGQGWEAPRTAPVFMQTLGSQFVAHPPIAPYRVEVSAPEHPLVAGIQPFEADDELYLSEMHPPFEMLLHTCFSGSAPGFAEPDWSSGERRPVMYLKRIGTGEVLYCTLGHARSRYDMQPLMSEYPHEERGSWKHPAFYELLRRALRWATRADGAAN